MMSVFDWSEVSSTERDRNWSGREWFVVRKAEVRMSVDQTLVPVVKMGVEAREQNPDQDWAGRCSCDGKHTSIEESWWLKVSSIV